jgi:hypothetical protein
VLDDHDEPGFPLRLVPWLERMQFQRSVTDTYREQRPDAWPAFRDELHRALSPAFGLSGSFANHDPSAEAPHIDRRRLTQLLDQACERFDPAVQWEETRELLWAGLHAR